MKAEEIIDLAIDNAKQDRSTISIQISELSVMLAQGTMSDHQNAGMTLSKYLETSQRSNDQLIKLVDLQRKIEKEKDIEDDDEDEYDKFSNNNE
jgi:hypothetical protein